jgi:ribosome-binding protein aMBF1 (putative translation factor)
MDVNDFWLDKIDATINSLADKCRQVREENIELLRVVQRLEARLDATIKERDDARREVCWLSVYDPEYITPYYAERMREEASKRGWDCCDTLSD